MIHALFQGSARSRVATMLLSGLFLINHLRLARAAGDSPNEKDSEQFVQLEVAKPPVFWQRTREAAEQEIKQRPDALPRIPIGTWLHCGQGAKVKVHLTEGVKTYENGERIPIPYLTKAQSELLDKEGKGLFRKAGRPRGEERVFSPLQDSFVWPRSLVIRWDPLPEGTVTIVVREKAIDQTELWKKSRIDGGIGQYADNTLRDAVGRWRNKNGPGKARLELDFSTAGDKTSLQFDVLSLKAEQELADALQQWDSQTAGITRHLGRAEVFRSMGLLPESAAEYEDALKLDPEDALIRRRTASANIMIDNVARAKQLLGNQAEP